MQYIKDVPGMEPKLKKKLSMCTCNYDHSSSTPMELNKINMLLKFQYANRTKAIFTMPYLKSSTKVILFALVKTVGFRDRIKAL